MSSTTTKPLNHQPSASGRVSLGVDVGGTKVAAGAVDDSGHILYQCSVPMIPDRGSEAGLEAVNSAIRRVLERAADNPAWRPISGIGICSPGPLDPSTGTILNPPNLPCWHNYPLASEVTNAYRLPVTVDNDGNAAALAEALWGAGRGYRNVFCTTIGTGIGTGIIFNGEIYHGRTGAAAEGGHMSIDRNGPRCGCGKAGCIEAFAAGPAIAKRARAKLKGLPTGNTSLITELCNCEPDRITSEMVGRAYTAGDELARQTLLETADLLSFWLGNIVDLLEPDVIVFGGGAGTMLQPLLPEISRRLSGYCINSRCQEIPVVPATHGANAGIVGGAALCFSGSSV